VEAGILAPVAGRASIPARWLPAGVPRAELHPDQDANGHQQQPRGEQHMHREAEDGYGNDGEDDEGNDRKHGDRFPFMSRRADVSRLPVLAAGGDREQPWFDPEKNPGGIRVGPELVTGGVVTRTAP
jgi:hypothetical protein